VIDIPPVGSSTVRLPILKDGIKSSTFVQQSATVERTRLVCRKEINIQADRAPIGWYAGDVKIRRDVRVEHKPKEAEKGIQ